MDHETELQLAQAEVHKAIGRNLLLFQRAEHSLKHLNALGSLVAKPGQLHEMFAAQKADFETRPMGLQIAHFLKNHCIPQKPIEETLDGCNDTMIGFDMSFAKNDRDRNAWEESLENLRSERNHLVHQMFAEYDSDSIDQCQAMHAKLIAQREKILPEFRRVGRSLQSTHESFRCIAEYLASPEGQAEWQLSYLQSSPLVQSLVKLAPLLAEPDGWTSLGDVAKQIRKQEPDLISAMITEFESRSFTGLVLATQLFDVKHEQTDSPHARAFYRVKPPQPHASEAEHQS